MARIQISDLPEDREITKEEMKKIAGGFTFSTLTNPWVIAGTVATAIAVPVAIHNAKDQPESP